MTALTLVAPADTPRALWVPPPPALPGLPDVVVTPPDLHMLLPSGQTAQIPGLLWPEQAAAAAHDPQGASPLVISRIKKDEFNQLLTAWNHPLGEFERPFGYQGFTLDVAGTPVALAVSASTVSTTVEGVHRRELVELARIARHPDHPRSLRAMLRLWTDYLTPEWDRQAWRARPDRRWRTRMAVSYALPGKIGNLYRFDGWTKIGPRKPSAGGGTWSNEPQCNDMDDGVKTLWVYPFTTTTDDDLAAAA